MVSYTKYYRTSLTGSVKTETRRDTKVSKLIMALTRITANQNYMQ
jgi:hypothetical protein